MFEAQATLSAAPILDTIVIAGGRGIQRPEISAKVATRILKRFSKVLKTVFGEPPSDFVQNLRLNEARRRLSKRQKTLRTVAASVGFPSQDSFHRAFERKFGSRPDGYLEDRQQRCVAASNGSHES